VFFIIILVVVKVIRGKKFMMGACWRLKACKEDRSLEFGNRVLKGDRHEADDVLLSENVEILPERSLGDSPTCTL